MNNYKNTSEELNNGGYDFPILEDYHYVKIGATNVAQLAKSGIINKKSLDMLQQLKQNKPDGLIILGKNTVKVLIEYKKSGIINSVEDAENVVTDWYYDLAKELKCNIICASDGNNYYFFNTEKSLIKDEYGNPIRSSLYLPKIADRKITKENGKEIIDLINTLSTTSADGAIIPEQTLNPTDLAKSVWQILFVNTGKEPEKCLYNVVEIFIFKFLSDIGILEDDMCFDYIYTMSLRDKEKALKRYAQNIRTEIKNQMFPKSEIDGTTIFNGTIFVNEKDEPVLAQKDLFAEVLSIFKKYEIKNGTFSDIDKSFKTRLYESFLRQSAGISALGQYFTPRNVVVSMINMLNQDSITETAKICDPFCGVGGFILELLNQFPKLKDNYKPVNGSINPKIELLGFDKGTSEKDDERTIILAKANMLIYFSDFIKKYKECLAEFSNNAFNAVFHLIKTNLGTFELDKYKDYFDLILTNPPYVTRGSKSIKNAIINNGFEEMYPVDGKGLEGLALDWIIYSLKPGGRALIVVPDGVFSRTQDNDIKLRNYIIDKCILNGIISLPPETFYATRKKTYILSLTKKEDDNVKQNTPVFTYIVSEIGETRDALRTPTENNLIEMSKLYRQYMACPNDFETTNKRCKLFKIDNFIDKQWLIERLWSNEEKLLLNISDEQNEINEDDFSDFIYDMGVAIEQYKQPIITEEDKTQECISISLTDKDYFKIEQNKLGYTEEQYRELNTKNEADIPLYTAKLYPVAYLNLKSNKLFKATPEEPLISFGDDGDGTAGTNIIFHISNFYNNASRKVLKILNQDILPEYVFCRLQDMKQKYGFNHIYKCNENNLSNVIIEIPINDDGSINIEKQKEYSKRYTYIAEQRKQFIDLLKRIENAQIKIDF